MIQTIQQATNTLLSYIPKPGSMHHNYKLERMQQLMELIGNPQNTYPVVHIAGTSGKTSTAYFIQGLLQAAGKKTGLTVSPHIQSITERIQIDGKPLSEELFVRYLNQLLEKVENVDITPTYFELLVALAYLTFKEEKVDYAVIETGLGGLLDGTNVVTRPDKVCVITDIGLDHTDVLGKTLPEIALQKAGIVQPGNTLILQQQVDNIANVIADEAVKRQVDQVLMVPDADVTLALSAFQRRNWAAATTTYKYIAKRDVLPKLATISADRAMLHQAPGRMELFTVGQKTIILDGAHNQQKLQALMQSLREKHLDSLTVVVSFVSDKHYLLNECLGELQPLTKELIVTDFSALQDMGRSAGAIEDITEAARKRGFSQVSERRNPQQAIDYALAQPGDTVLVTGSLYLVAQVRSYVASL